MKLNWHPPKIDNIKARFKSEADHSFDVHFGKLRADRSIMPARPFIDSAVSLTAFEEIIKEAYRRGNGEVGDRLTKAFIDLCEELHKNIKTEITSEKWAWDRPTWRSDGSVVGSPRDIVDTEELIKSQKWKIVDD